MQQISNPHRQPYTPTTRPLSAALSLLALTGLAELAGAQTAVSPGDRAALEGSSSTSYPLGRFNCRYQQLYSDLSSQTVIRGHGYRRDALSSRGEIKAFRTELEVSLSTVIQLPEKISKTFSSNVGSNATKVLSKSWVSFPTTQKPSKVPADFDFRIPYSQAYVWSGKGTLALDMTIWANQTTGGNNLNFGASLDSQQLYSSARNLQPGYRFGSGCPANGSTKPAWCGFEVRHEGSRMDLAIDARWGVPTTSAGPGNSALLLSLDAKPWAWPGSTRGCMVYGKTEVVLPLSGDNSTSGAYKAVIKVGTPPPAMFELTGQILSYARHSGEVVLSDPSRLIAPPAGRGVVSARLIHATDRTATTGSTSTTVPVSLFY